MGNGRSPSAMLVLWNVTEPCTGVRVVWSAAHTYTPPPRTGYWLNCATLPPSEVKMDSNITQTKNTPSSLKWRRIVAARGNTVKYWFIEIYWFLIRGRVRRPCVIISEHRLKHFYHTVTKISTQVNTPGYTWRVEVYKNHYLFIFPVVSKLRVNFSPGTTRSAQFLERHVSIIFRLSPAMLGLIALRPERTVTETADPRRTLPSAATAWPSAERRRGKYLGGAQAASRDTSTPHTTVHTNHSHKSLIIIIINQSRSYLCTSQFSLRVAKFTLSNFTKVANNTKTLGRPGDFPLPVCTSARTAKARQN